MIEDTLKDRGKRYGNFEDHAMITQALKRVAREFSEKSATRDKMAVHHWEALDMIFHKIGRILNGDPDYSDSWHDIAGYATLVEQILGTVDEDTKIDPPVDYALQFMLDFSPAKPIPEGIAYKHYRTFCFNKGVLPKDRHEHFSRLKKRLSDQYIFSKET